MIEIGGTVLKELKQIIKESKNTEEEISNYTYESALLWVEMFLINIIKDPGHSTIMKHLKPHYIPIEEVTEKIVQGLKLEDSIHQNHILTYRMKDILDCLETYFSDEAAKTLPEFYASHFLLAKELLKPLLEQYFDIYNTKLL